MKRILAVRMCKKAVKQVWREVKKREQFFIKKKESWQDSVLGDRYMEKTEQLRELAEAMDEQLTYF